MMSSQQLCRRTIKRSTIVALLAMPVALVLADLALAQTPWGACGSQDFSHVNPQPPAPDLGSLLNTAPPRPGPDILYAPLAIAPQLENTGPWNAAPILISGSSAYRSGEFLYQDFIYDDTGRNTYPTDTAKYAGNAADFVELRLKPMSGGTAVRITYNTMIDPELTGATIALGGSTDAYSMPYSANARAPGQVFVTVHGSTVDAVDAASGAPLVSSGLAAVVDTQRRQVHVCVPYSVFEPRGNTQVRVAAATGLWDVVNNRYNFPGTTATATRPGGANANNPNATAFFNVAFRYSEPLTNFATANQNTTITSGNLQNLFANVDFVALANGVNDDMPGKVGGVPQTGRMNRIFASHFETAQGRGSAATLQPTRCPATGCGNPTFSGRLQIYSVYVPSAPPPPEGYGFFLSLHYLSGNMNTEPLRWHQQASQLETPYLSITPNARGPGYWYYGLAAADVFEAWADVARRYKLNPNLASIGGTSMGSFGTWKFSGQYPDLFGSAQSQVNCPSAGTGWVQGTQPPGGVSSLMILTAPNTRWLPQYNWFGTLDTTCAYWAESEYQNLLDQLGYRYNKISFVHGHVGSPMIGDEYGPMVDFMKNKAVKRDPQVFTYVMNGEQHEPSVGVTSDHVYWVSGLTLRNGSVSPPIGKVEVISMAFGLGIPTSAPTQTGSGIYVGTTGPVSYTYQTRDWTGETPPISASNSIKLTAQNIRTITIDPVRARVDCNVMLRVLTDGPLDVTLDGCGPSGVRHFGN